MIRTTNLRKKFRLGNQEMIAVDGLNLEINDGGVYGILGPNGAGKTTLFRLLTCLLKPSSGTAEVSGYDVVRQAAQVRENVGLLCEEPSLYEKQTVHDNLLLFGELYGLSRSKIETRISELSKTLGFKDLVNRKAGALSKGQRQRVSIARSLLHEPNTLLLDEPTANLDPETANEVRNAIDELKDSKRTIVVSSHNLAEIERISDNVAIIDDGRIIKSGSVSLLKQEFSAKKVSIAYTGSVDDSIAQRIQTLPGVREVVTGEDEKTHKNLVILMDHSISDQRKEDIISLIVKMMAASSDCKIVSVGSPELSLEQVYLKLVRQEASEEKDEVGT